MDKISARSRMQKQRKATMGRKKILILCMVVFCMFGVPLILATVLPAGKNGNAMREERAEADERTLADSGYYVLCERATGILQVPMEDYLISTLAQLMEPDTPVESLRVLAVLLRTQIVYEAEQGRKYYGEDYRTQEELFAQGETEQNLQIYRAAVRDTAGIVMTWQGEVMETAYHAVSAGSTRSGAGTMEFLLPYLESVTCEGDLMSPQYRNRIVYSKGDFFQKLQTLTGNGQLTAAEVIIEERDSAGYVTALTIHTTDAQDMRIGGEDFRMILHLPSANFTIEEENGQIIFLCKGVGHGYGVSLYTASLLADEGNDFMEIIRYFYPETVFMRIA